MRLLFIGLLGLGGFLPVSAQNFIDKLERQEAGKGKVVVYQDALIEQLVNGVRVNPVETPVSSGASSGTPSQTSTAPKTYRSKVSVMGYRIQVFSGGNSRASREQAMSKGNQVKKYFADMPVYTHFYSPRWTCRVGDFKTYAEASMMLQELKATGAFGEAVIVKCKIQVAN